MPEILLLAAIALPLLAALPGLDRRAAIAAALLSTACAAAALIAAPPAAALAAFGSPGAPLLRADALSSVPLLLYACLALGVLVASPRRDPHRDFLLLLSGTLTVYAAGNVWVLLAGWTLSAVPLLVRRGPAESPAPVRRLLPAAAMAASVILLAAGLALLGPAPLAAFVLIVLAALVRKGLFPFHTWVVAAFQNGPLLTAGLVANAHLGAFVIARVAIPLLPDYSRDALTLVSNLALISGLYAAFAGLGERRPRRSLALLMISQSSFILSGLESRNAEGIAGALTSWMVVAAATMGLLIVFRALEKRCAGLGDTEFAGLAATAPRLAVFFAICGLALVGLPGTLGFAAEDLLFHGALAGHPLLGVALPLATALNAINVYRLFSSLFLGQRATRVPVFPDALRGERLVLTALVLFLILAGVVPSAVVSSRSGPAEAIASLLALN
ncbi:MAG TPA: hypothetical protein DEH78_20460 [Solibacterales bacterium]|nr:hypothetical protein [Bryobacterales bacterium]